MPTRTEQTQWFCARCQRPTLHQRQVVETNHVLHLLLTLFCCGFWLPFWLLIAIVDGFQNSPFLCTLCGQPAGQPTEQQRMHYEQEKAAAWKARGAATAKMASTVGGGIASAGKGLGQASRLAITAAIQELVRLPARTDNFLRVIAGEGNDLIFWFLRILTIVALAIGFVLIAVAVFTTATKLIGR